MQCWPFTLKGLNHQCAIALNTSKRYCGITHKVSAFFRNWQIFERSWLSSGHGKCSYVFFHVYFMQTRTFLIAFRDFHKGSYSMFSTMWSTVSLLIDLLFHSAIWFVLGILTLHSRNLQWQEKIFFVDDNLRKLTPPAPPAPTTTLLSKRCYQCKLFHFVNIKDLAARIIITQNEQNLIVQDRMKGKINWLISS